jgi:hypothetical protein
MAMETHVQEAGQSGSGSGLNMIISEHIAATLPIRIGNSFGRYSPEKKFV